MEVTISEYKGFPVISLPLDEKGKYPFSFGVAKAKAIVKYIEDIKKFVKDNSADKTEEVQEKVNAEEIDMSE